ncbi:phage major capsid protein [Anaplasma platys]|nr:phage major capsid protein [Anaplasma platys]
MTTELEIKDEITEFLPQHGRSTYPIEETSSSDEAILQKLDEFNYKFSEFENRLNKLEISSPGRINLKDQPEDLESKYLKEFVATGVYDQLSYKSADAMPLMMPKKVISYIDKLLHESSIMRKLCSVEKISGSQVEYFVTNNKDNYVGWSENNAAPASGTGTKQESAAAPISGAPKFSSLSVVLHELYAQPKISKIHLEDSFIDLERWLIDNLVEAFSRAENAAFISGNGSTKPLGILGVGTDITLMEVDKLDYDTIVKLLYSLHEYYASRASFLMHRSTLQEIRSFKSSSGQYLLQAGKNGEEIFGIPVYQTSEMPIAAADKAGMIALADFKSAYRIVENKDIRILRDPYTEKKFVKFYTTKRVGGNVVNSGAIKLLSFSTTVNRASS